MKLSPMRVRVSARVRVRGEVMSSVKLPSIFIRIEEGSSVENAPYNVL